MVCLVDASSCPSLSTSRVMPFTFSPSKRQPWHSLPPGFLPCLALGFLPCSSLSSRLLLESLSGWLEEESGGDAEEEEGEEGEVEGEIWEGGREEKPDEEE